MCHEPACGTPHLVALQTGSPRIGTRRMFTMIISRTTKSLPNQVRAVSCILGFSAFFIDLIFPFVRPPCLLVLTYSSSTSGDTLDATASLKSQASPIPAQPQSRRWPKPAVNPTTLFKLSASARPASDIIRADPDSHINESGAWEC